tara:strand:+ start:2238 stop:2795 length:558 start_codon:yes stop_codon:yes gene_type:complete
MNAKKDLDKGIQKSLKGESIRVNYLQEEDKYSKDRYHQVYKGYDFLGDISTVRAFIQKKHDIDWNTLELLLKLMALKVFSFDSFKDVPKRFHLNRWSEFLTWGYVNLIMDHEAYDKRIYCLNTIGRNIVVTFYEYLSGEKKIPEDSKFNPLASKSNLVKFDKKRMEMIKKLNKLETPEHNKHLFL